MVDVILASVNIKNTFSAYNDPKILGHFIIITRVKKAQGGCSP